jgi:hypothetical protein
MVMGTTDGELRDLWFVNHRGDPSLRSFRWNARNAWWVCENSSLDEPSIEARGPADVSLESAPAYQSAIEQAEERIAEWREELARLQGGT